MSNYLKRWINSWKRVLVDFFSSIGLFWLLLEIINYFFADFFQLYNFYL